MAIYIKLNPLKGGVGVSHTNNFNMSETSHLFNLQHGILTNMELYKNENYIQIQKDQLKRNPSPGHEPYLLAAAEVLTQ